MPKTTKQIIKIKRLKDGSYSLIKDENFIYMLGVGYGFHLKVLKAAGQTDNKIYSDGKNFTNLINKIMATGEKKNFAKTTITREEGVIFNEWLDCICEILIEADGINLQGSDLKRFFKLSQNFLKKTKIKTK